MMMMMTLLLMMTGYSSVSVHESQSVLHSHAHFKLVHSFCLCVTFPSHSSQLMLKVAFENKHEGVLAGWEYV
jgi:hypothetical protein